MAIIQFVLALIVLGAVSLILSFLVFLAIGYSMNAAAWR